MRTTVSEQEYVLGTDAEELKRLGSQHDLWREVAMDGWRRGNFKAGDALLDVGCGPGYTTFDLRRLVGDEGRVVGVDISQRFVEHLNRRKQEMNISNVAAFVSNVEEIELPEADFDGAFARWVLCFVAHPERVVEGVARALKPGAAFVVQDYCRYEGVTVAPWSDIFARVYGAVATAWRERGGDPDVGSRVPTLMHQAGFDVREINHITRVARPDSALWQWPLDFFKSYLPTLVAEGRITEAERTLFEDEWRKRTDDRAASFFFTPPMVEVVGVKR